MKLKEWENLSGILATHPTTETKAVSVVIEHDHEHKTKLWALSDYKVSSACGVVIWLVPIV